MKNPAPKAKRGIPFVVSAPSGTGKTTLCKMAVDFLPDLRHSISYTTREPREGDIDGVDYHFVDNAAFDRMIRQGEFLEHAGVYGKRYGTSKKALEALLEQGSDAVLEIDVQGAESVKKSLEGGVYIFILPPSLEACEERLRSRGKDSPEEIEKRLRIAVEEIKKASLYDYIVINDDLDAAYERLKAVIIAERARKERMLDRAGELLKASQKHKT